MLNPDFRDMLAAFIAEDVEFLVVGAYALAVHGVPRATGDLDVWVRTEPENAARVVRALEAFGAPTDQVTPDDFATPEVVYQVGIAPRRVDILTSIDGVAFPEAWQSRVLVDVDGLRIPVLGREHLIRNKRAVGRTRDLADLEDLENAGGA
jgi:hypothetical protein